MKKSIFLLSLLTSLCSIAQRVEKEYYSGTGTLSTEYQIDNATGTKNGFYNSYLKNGMLAETGSYNMDQEQGLWTTYDEAGSGQITSMMNYIGGMLHGISKEWKITPSGRYLWHDDVYEFGVKISGATYNASGMKESEFKNGVLTNLISESNADVQYINGKQFSYFQTRNNQKLLDKVEFDSMGMQVVYRYFNLQEIRSVTVSRYGQVLSSWEYDDPKRPTSKSPKLITELDSTSIHEALGWYIADPNPDKKPNIRYDLKTGDIIEIGGSTDHWHYLQTPKNSILVTTYESPGIKKFQYCFKWNGTEQANFGIERNFVNGELAWTQEFIDVQGFAYPKKNIKEYYPNGQVKVFKDAVNEMRKEYYESGALAKEFVSIDYSDSPIRFYKEYYENGALKMEIPLENPEKSSDVLGKTKLYYDEKGKLVKVDYCRKVDGVDQIDVLDDARRVGQYVMYQNNLKFNENYFIIKTLYSSGAPFKVEEYPKGKECYLKMKKVLDDIAERFDKADTDEQKQLLVLEHTRCVKRMVELGAVDTDRKLNEQLRKLKKVEDIRTALGL